MDENFERRPVVPAAVAIAAVPSKRISWGAVLAGTVVTLVAFMTLGLLGLAIGMAAYDPATEADSARNMAIGGMIWWLISALIALFLGGWAAGRLAAVPRRLDSALHGIATWGVSTLVLVLLLTTAVGSLIGGALNVVTNSMEVTPTDIERYSDDVSAMMGGRHRDMADLHDRDMNRGTGSAYSTRDDDDTDADVGVSGRVGVGDAGVSGGVRAHGDVDTDDRDGTAGVSGGVSGTVDADRDADNRTMADRTETTTGSDMRRTTAENVDDAEDMSEAERRAMATSEARRAEDAAETAAAAAGWSFLMMLVGASAAAAGGAVATPKRLSERAAAAEDREAHA